MASEPAMASTPRVISSPSCSNSRWNWPTSEEVRSCSTWRNASCACSSISQATAPTLAVMLIVTRRSSLVFNDKFLSRSFHPELVQVPLAVHPLLPIMRGIVQPQRLGNMGHGQNAMASQRRLLRFKNIFRTAGRKNRRRSCLEQAEIVKTRGQRRLRIDRLQRHAE